MYTIAIQGYQGAFHDIAARLFHGDAVYEIKEAVDFETVIDHVQEGVPQHRAMMAIENTLFGSLLGNYQLLSSANIRVVGELYLRIQQNLMAAPGQKIEDLTEVYSHPIAIAQCRTFFKNHPYIKLIETEDTAGSAKLIRDGNLRGKGAIASTLAADIYNMEILERGIESNKLNFTRFLALAPSNDTFSDIGPKVSMFFTVDHNVGSLYKVIGALAEVGVNLTKIQSTPIIGKPFEYMFFVDFLLPNAQSYVQAIHAIENNSLTYKILGRYQQGSHYED